MVGYYLTCAYFLILFVLIIYRLILDLFIRYYVQDFFEELFSLWVEQGYLVSYRAMKNTEEIYKYFWSLRLERDWR